METGVVEAAGATLAWTSAGAGASLVLVHDIAADAACWAPGLPGLGGRSIAYDRRGYGASSAPVPYTATTVEEQAEDLVALLRALAAAPARLLGDGFGALVALDVAKRYPALVAGLVLVDPPLFAFVPAATEAMAATRQALEQALRAGGPPAGVAAWLEGEPPGRIARAQESTLGFLADYAGFASWPVTRRELRAMTMPAVVLTRPDRPAHLVAASDTLAALLPASRRVVDGDPLALQELR